MNYEIMQMLPDPVYSFFGVRSVWNSAFHNALKIKKPIFFVTTAKHRSSKASLHFVGDVIRTLFDQW